VFSECFWAGRLGFVHGWFLAERWGAIGERGLFAVGIASGDWAYAGLAKGKAGNSGEGARAGRGDSEEVAGAVIFWR